MKQISDFTKTSRQQYTPLLRISHDENPNDPMVCNWLARVLSFENNHECVTYFKKYLSLPTATWDIERSAAMRSISVFEDKEKWLRLAIQECEYFRPPYYDLANLYYQRQDWANCLAIGLLGLSKSYHTNTYLESAEAHRGALDDLVAISFWNLGVIEKSYEHAKKASELSPDDQRMQNNFKYIATELNK